MRFHTCFLKPGHGLSDILQDPFSGGGKRYILLQQKTLFFSKNLLTITVLFRTIIESLQMLFIYGFSNHAKFQTTIKLGARKTHVNSIYQQMGAMGLLLYLRANRKGKACQKLKKASHSISRHISLGCLTQKDKFKIKLAERVNQTAEL